MTKNSREEVCDIARRIYNRVPFDKTYAQVHAAIISFSQLFPDEVRMSPSALFIFNQLADEPAPWLINADGSLTTDVSLAPAPEEYIVLADITVSPRFYGDMPGFSPSPQYLIKQAIDEYLKSLIFRGVVTVRGEVRVL